MASTRRHRAHRGPIPATISPESARPETPVHSGRIPAALPPRSAQLDDQLAAPGGRSDRALQELARKQHGALTSAQIQGRGLSPRAVRNRAASGRLRRVHAGVYAVERLNDRGRWMAAVLACGRGAVLSHRSAAALWGFGERRASSDVSVLNRAGRSRAGIDVHRAGALDPTDVTIRDGIPCTTPARTLLDIAGVVDRRTLERALDRAEALHAFDLDALQEVLRRNPRRRGRRALAALLAEYDGPTVTRSDSEERLLALASAAGLPRPRVNSWIALDDNSGYEADFLWPDARLIVEVDGRTHHARRRAFVHDRERDRRLALAGYETRRYAASELQSRPDRVVDELRRFLSLHAGPTTARYPPKSAQYGQGPGDAGVS